MADEEKANIDYGEMLETLFLRWSCLVGRMTGPAPWGGIWDR